ncbi:unnamed protein product [Paramecium primaurelia]|uniref:C2H2-type domain-containing protein n=1 Tax=Paramecium primaurelia TaxID=5886 RepID=A0A8S1KYE7_PARPR|nr:unnamed protein product [Paramecium primaurelia]
MDQQELICFTCHKVFKLKRALQEHQLIHSGEKPYRCVTCNQQFRQYSSLQKHDRIHTGEKPYSCQECDQSFSQISNLKRHQFKHKEQKPYTCEVCQKQFITNQNYQQHYNKHKQQRQSYVCECNRTFLYKCSLKKHQKIHQKLDNTDQFINLQQINQISADLRIFFTASHPQILHFNHIDILFNGRLYNYNEQTGRIELHDLIDQQQQNCEPIKDHQHFDSQTQYELIKCIDCKQERCCCKQKQLFNNCCLACNGGNCGETPFAISQIIHFHGPNCGHPIVIHNEHIDYLVNEMLHYPHDGHCDNHGILNRIRVK